MSSDKKTNHVEVQAVQEEMAKLNVGLVGFDDVAEGVRDLDGSDQASEIVDVKKIARASILAVFFRREFDLMKKSIEAPIVAVLDRIRSCVQGVTDRVSDAIVRRTLPMVVNPINRMPEYLRTIKGTLYTGEQIARAIPDKTAFLSEVALMEGGTFFELNKEGQLVMMEAKSTPVANALEARILQTRITCRREDGAIAVMTGKELFIVTKRDENGVPLAMELSEEAKQISPESILMQRGLPTLQFNNDKHTGEYTRMWSVSAAIWTEDESLDIAQARYASWVKYGGTIVSDVSNACDRNKIHISMWEVGTAESRGVLRVNLDFES